MGRKGAHAVPPYQYQNMYSIGPPCPNVDDDTRTSIQDTSRPFYQIERPRPKCIPNQYQILHSGTNGRVVPFVRLDDHLVVDRDSELLVPLALACPRRPILRLKKLVQAYSCISTATLSAAVLRCACTARRLH
eukprot:510172-Rhodomonas_salina.1